MKSLRFRCAAVLCAVAAAAVLAASAGTAVRSQNGAGKPAKAESLPGFDLASIDRNAAACQDFNQFANGGWKAANPIPAAFSRWGRFEQLSEQNNEQLRAILDELSKRKNLKPGSNEQKIADFYSACMDKAGVEAQGAKPLEPELARIGAIKDVGGLREAVARFHAHRIPAVFGFGAAQDYKDSRSVIAQAVQGGLGLPDRDFYTKDDERSRKIRDEYVAHVARTFQLLGDDADRAAAAARTVMAVETRLAENSASRVQLRNPEARYNP
ncbi:MAG TPA: M13 family metallopeptidase N-terminal domain-containing protein, partial [Pyrinomonadaceae bacterium]